MPFKFKFCVQCDAQISKRMTPGNVGIVNLNFSMGKISRFSVDLFVSLEEGSVVCVNV